MKARVFDWDWKDPAPWKRIAAYAAELSEVFLEFYNAGNDAYVLIIADHAFSDEEADKIYEEYSLPGLIWSTCKQAEEEIDDVFQFTPTEIASKLEITEDVARAGIKTLCEWDELTRISTTPETYQLLDKHNRSDYLKDSFDGAATLAELSARLREHANHYDTLARDGWQLEGSVNVSHVEMHRRT
jgi:hypothetical protein